MSGDTLFIPSAEGAPFAFSAEEAAALADAVLERFAGRAIEETPETGGEE